MSSLNKLSSWIDIGNHSKKISDKSLNEMFKEDKDRFNKFSIQGESLLLDFSKNHIDDKMMKLFFQLLDEIDLKGKMKDYYNGKKINTSENRSVLHFLLRGSYNSKTKELYYNDVKKGLEKLKSFSKKFRNGDIKGYSGKKIKNVINIGIGGSDLGPKMICEALKYYSNRDIQNYFISNVDPSNLSEVLQNIDPNESIFIISSKSFGTIETLKNANICKNWFYNHTKSSENVKNHFFGVTANTKRAKEFGIVENNIFPIWDWVGGRYSLWSSVGLPIILKIGFENFEKLLSGANEIDNHFKNEPYDKNIPIILACLGVLYNNFHNCETHAIFPYDHYLKYLPMYLQQADMESNGKNTSKDSLEVQYSTGPILWGDVGTNGQHSFFQLIHQGTKKIPCDFIGFVNSNNEKEELHEILLSNMIGQTMALMKGKKMKEVEKELGSETKYLNYEILKNSKVFKGNKPSNTLLFDKLTPYNLGRLIAIYEHKIFVQGSIWNINSFDQWGVELGKILSDKVYKKINKNDRSNIDNSTSGQLDFIKKFRQ
ncbi:MAG: glucose-6-phosphate isomerase [Flammeovirgaceae bacterium TMED290]|nr:MAG: glucose-6-phosphate isomerase [Flammeovirgaceae bacterium TMED290]|tara:strand:+ start:6993 stop:8621 length:1629 start_codon:yes stop_codon:yes gene_type:complete